MLSQLISQLRPLLHPMLVHFPIALLFASVALDWAGYWIKHPNLTRAGFYVLMLGALGAGVAALTGPDHVTGDASVMSLLADHQNFASLTVALAVSMTAVRFLTVGGIRGSWALLYLLFTLLLLVTVTLAGYYGGELTYHHGVAVTVLPVRASAPAVRPLVPAHPFVALLGFLSLVGLFAWFIFGRSIVPTYYASWWNAVRQEYGNAGAPLWTLQRGAIVTSTPSPQRQAIYQR